MTLIFKSGLDPYDRWRKALLAAMPELKMREWDEPGDAADIEFALVWKPPLGALRQFPNLKAVFSLGAGVDHLLCDPDLPDVPVIRMVDPELTRGMTEYVTLHVLRYHRAQPALEAQQRDKQWREIFSKTAPKRQVGIMGLGVLGTDAARILNEIGFDLAGWSRLPKNLPGVACFSGSDGLEPFLARTEILVCLLPSTVSTQGILNEDLFMKLPEGAYLINAGRGDLQKEDDIVAALESGRLHGATLDVFESEPLSKQSPLWSHPRVTVTPHIAAYAQPWSAAKGIADNIKRIQKGDAPLHTVDMTAGY